MGETPCKKKKKTHHANKPEKAGDAHDSDAYHSFRMEAITTMHLDSTVVLEQSSVRTICTIVMSDDVSCHGRVNLLSVVHMVSLL